MFHLYIYMAYFMALGDREDLNDCCQRTYATSPLVIAEMVSGDTKVSGFTIEEH